MANALYQQVEQLSRDKGIDPQIVVAAIEDAILLATRKYYKTQEELRSEMDRESGEIRVYAIKLIVENVLNEEREIALRDALKLDPAAVLGGEVKVRKSTEGLGRIAAQTAKQVIFQKVREAERDTIYNDYINRVGEMVHAVVKRIENFETIVDLDKGEARLPKREQSRLESFTPGERIRVVIKNVEKSAKGPQVVVSRTEPLLVQRLFESEVPEIYDGTIVIQAVAREAGERTKIAVYSRDKDVDCVGACVGMKGMRVQSVIRELRGEKIDIIEYHSEIAQFAANALIPAKISRVTILDSEAHHLEVVVDDTQLSLAIGKKGQNVRLASKLLSWKVDIKSEEEKRREVEEQMAALVSSPPSETALAQLAGLSETVRANLAAANITTVEQLGGMTPEQLQEIPGIGPKTVEKIFVLVNRFFGANVEGANAEEGEEGGTPAPDSPDAAGPRRESGATGTVDAETGVDDTNATAAGDTAGQALDEEREQSVLDVPAASERRKSETPDPEDQSGPDPQGPGAGPSL